MTICRRSGCRRLAPRRARATDKQHRCHRSRDLGRRGQPPDPDCLGERLSARRAPRARYRPGPASNVSTAGGVRDSRSRDGRRHGDDFRERLDRPGASRQQRTEPATARAQLERRCLLFDRPPRGRLGTRGSIAVCPSLAQSARREHGRRSRAHRPASNRPAVLLATLHDRSWFQVKAPASPTFAAEVQGNAVTLSWDDPGNTTHLELEVGSSSGLRNLLVMSLNGTSFTASGVPHGTYYLRLRAINELGRSLPSQEITLVVPRARGALDGTTS